MCLLVHWLIYVYLWLIIFCNKSYGRQLLFVNCVSIHILFLDLARFLMAQLILQYLNLFCRFQFLFVHLNPFANKENSIIFLIFSLTQSLVLCVCFVDNESTMFLWRVVVEMGISFMCIFCRWWIHHVPMKGSDGNGDLSIHWTHKIP